MEDYSVIMEEEIQDTKSKKMKSKQDQIRDAALKYHSMGRKGKIEVIASKPCFSQYDLTLAYTPGVAQPCLEIQKDAHLSREYTAKGNLVAVISNGTAVLGLGNIGALAGKPVMEGKGVLFKRFADIDVFDIEIDNEDPEVIIETVKNIAPTFGGINLEDIKAPECFYIEERLKKETDIPVFHDDQHGTAIISGAALLNALELVEKQIEDVKVVFSGAGAAGIACANFYISLGVKSENILLTDSRGVLWNGRGDEESNIYKQPFFRNTECRTLADAMVGADVFCGASVKNLLKPEMVKSMAARPIVFAMANPDPEITYDEAKGARPDVIVATGRSDFPNQVNNVLGFPFIFRGALDVEATSINEEMKMAAAWALAKLAKEEVPDSVKKAYGDDTLAFGPDYIIPKPFDPRVLIWESVAVAEAAIKSGVARKKIDLDIYRQSLLEKVDWTREVMRKINIVARRDPRRIVFPEAMHPKIIAASEEIVSDGLAKPILLAKNKQELLDRFEELNHNPDGIQIIEQKHWPHRDKYIDEYYNLRQRKGMTIGRSYMDMKNHFNFGTMMLRCGHADAMLAGISVSYPQVLKPALKLIRKRELNSVVAGLYLTWHNSKLIAMADCTVNINPTAEELAEITLLSANELIRLHVNPIIAMVSFTNFSAVRCPETEKVARAVEIVKSRRPDLMIDGPVQADIAFDQDHLSKYYPFANIHQRPNLIVFPSLDAGNIALRMLKQFSNIHMIGPLLLGMSKPIHLLPRECDVSNIMSMAAIATVDAQSVITS